MVSTARCPVIPYFTASFEAVLLGDKIISFGEGEKKMCLLSVSFAQKAIPNLVVFPEGERKEVL